jgi:hypothetical protein
MSRKSATEKPIVVSTGAAAAAPARRKPSTPKRVTRTAEPGIPTVAVEPSEDAIAKLAYSYWVARGCQGGSPDEDWLRAEQELRAAK